MPTTTRSRCRGLSLGLALALLSGLAACRDVDECDSCDDGHTADADADADADAGTDAPGASCGDGTVQAGEECDDGNRETADGCTNLCRLARCGDGILHFGPEQCDDGNQDSADACLPTCVVATCGDGAVRAGVEACDDGNARQHDGCTLCTIDDGFACAMAPSVCATVCGDGVIVAGAETCDQGGGNTADGDGCSATCQTEPGWACVGTPSTCVNQCGDGIVDAGEQCDDGNLVSGDGCNDVCQFDLPCGPGETSIVVANNTGFGLADLESGWSSVQVSSNDIVSKVAVFVSMSTSTYGGVVIAGPRGIWRVLSSRYSTSSTVFDDGAPSSIVGATPPFNGRFRPEQTISSSAAGFRGQLAGGVWTLHAWDGFNDLAGSVLQRWSVILCTSPIVPRCGDGNLDLGEECDDGNDVAGDACNNACGFTTGCGNDVIEPGEDCDDDNRVAGDGCSETCTIEQPCPAGQVAVVVGASPHTPIPDHNYTGITSTVAVPIAGAVMKARVFLTSIIHARDLDLRISLESPRAIGRPLSTNRGSWAANYIRTLFDDSATTLLSAPNLPPFTGAFRPEVSLSATSGIDYRRQQAGGDWILRVVDDRAGETGVLHGWKLLLCIDPVGTTCGDGEVNDTEECDDGNDVDNDGCSKLCQIADGCGDGNLDASEACDDGNATSGDGCSRTCQPELSCPAGQVAVLVSNGTPVPIPDDDQVTGAASDVTVTEVGAVVSAKVSIGRLTHGNTDNVDLYLDHSTRGIRRELSTDNGSGMNYAGTLFADTAPASIIGRPSPFTGTFRPEASLSTSPGVDLRRQPAAGTWSLRVFDDVVGVTGRLDAWSLLLCVDPLATFCGDSMVSDGEECDDGNAVDGDVCSNLCGIRDGCGDGNFDAGEQCDDDNLVSGDGCSATCTLDIMCAAGEVPVIVDSTSAVMAPDGDVAGATSGLVVTTVGLVRKALVTVHVTHPVNADVDLYVQSPFGGQRVLATDLDGASYANTTFSDAAVRAITAGVAEGVAAPYTGTYRPVETLAYFHGESAEGDWFLRIADDGTAGMTGTLDSWSLALCVDPAMPRRCGNGVVEATEQCDDVNAVGGDGCSMLCQLELGCAAGQVPLVVTSNDERMLIPDATPAGFTSTIDVAGAGTVAKAVVLVNALGHNFDDDLDLTLLSPSATMVVLSSDNGSSGNDYLATIFSDAAGPPIASADSSATAPPFRGRWRPEGMLSAVNGQAAAGPWGLTIVDDATGDTGMFRTWSLGLCVAP